MMGPLSVGSLVQAVNISILFKILFILWWEVLLDYELIYLGILGVSTSWSPQGLNRLV